MTPEINVTWNIIKLRLFNPVNRFRCYREGCLKTVKARRATMASVSPVRKLFEFGNFLNELICHLTGGHSSIDVLKEEKKLRRQRWKKMEESCTWWWSSRVETCQLTPVKIIRYRSKMSKRISLNCLLYTSRDWTSGPNVSKVSKIWREEKPHPRCKRMVNGNWIYAPYISWPRIGENLNSLIFDFARRL